MPIPREQSGPFHRDFTAALAFATELHSSQYRKETDIPHVSHLISVAGLVLEHGGSRDQAIAALLHDSIEDQSADYPGGPPALKAEIARRFGNEVLAIVEGCTDGLPEEKTKDPIEWAIRKERYIRHLAEAPDSIRLVSCADKLHNARAILSDLRIVGSALWDRPRLPGLHRTVR